MFLVGGASLPPLVAYFTRNLLHNPAATLPIRLFNVGRQYRNQAFTEAAPPNLLNVRQLTAVQGKALITYFT